MILWKSSPTRIPCPYSDYVPDVAAGRADGKTLAHFATCTECREELRFAAEIKAALMDCDYEDFVVPPELNKRVLARLLERIEEEERANEARQSSISPPLPPQRDPPRP